GRKLLQRHRQDDIVASSMVMSQEDTQSDMEKKEKIKCISTVPERYITTAFILFILMITALISNRLGELTGLIQAVWALILGILFTEIGFLEKDSLNRAKSYGFLMFILMVYIFSGLKDATPEILSAAIGPMALIIVLGVSGMALLSIVAGRVLKISWNMAFAVSLTALYGFPPNAVITEEVCTALAKTSEEKEFLMGKMLPMMLVGGLVTVTITSVVLAGVFAGML